MPDPRTAEELEAEAGRLLVASARARAERMGPQDAHELRHLLAAVNAGNSDPCEGGAYCHLDRAALAAEPVPVPTPDDIDAGVDAIVERYGRALDALGGVPSIDVERLARALERIALKLDRDLCAMATGDAARMLAAEYARLATPPEPKP